MLPIFSLLLMLCSPRVHSENSTKCHNNFSFRSLAKIPKQLKTIAYYWSFTKRKIIYECDSENRIIPENRNESLHNIDTIRAICSNVFKTRILYERDGQPWILSGINRSSELSHISKCRNCTAEQNILRVNIRQSESAVDILSNTIVNKLSEIPCKYDEGLCCNDRYFMFWEVRDDVLREIPSNVMRECQMENTTNYLLIKDPDNEIRRLQLKEIRSLKNISYRLTDRDDIVVTFDKITVSADNNEMDSSKHCDIVPVDANNGNKNIQINSRFLDTIDDEKCIYNETLKNNLGSVQKQLVITAGLCILCLVIIFIFLSVTVYNYYLSGNVVSLKGCFVLHFFQGHVNRILYNRIKDIDFKLNTHDNEYTYIADDVFLNK